MWSPVAAIKKSFRKASNDSDDLPPPAPLSEGGLTETPSAQPRRSRLEDAGMWSPVAALKRSFRRSKASSASVPTPPAPLLTEEDLRDVNLSNGEFQTSNNSDTESSNRNNSDDSNQEHNESDDQKQPQQPETKNSNKTSPEDSDGNADGQTESTENEEGEEVENGVAPSGFNTRLSGFNTQLLPDDDFGDLVDDDEDDDDDDDYQEPKSDDEFDFAAESDDDLIDRAFFGVDVSDSEGEEEYFNEWYLMDDEEGFLAPILFEDGMNSDECDLYYITLEKDMLQATNPSPHGISMARRSLPTKFRSALPLRTFEEEEDDELPSCLRDPKKRPVQEELVPFRRRSFGGLPALLEAPEFYRPHSCPDLSALHLPHHQPKVNFDTEVQVVSVFAANDYPRKIRSNLWFTKKQIRASRKEASYERRRERRQREKDEAAGRGTF